MIDGRQAGKEVDVIGRMLEAALARFEHPDYRIYVGCYPNDPETQAAITAVAKYDDRVRLVVSPHEGPTTAARPNSGCACAIAAPCCRR